MIELFVLPAIAPPDAPMAPGWWPLPPGWWILGGLLIFVVVWFLGRLLKRLLPPPRIIAPDTRTFALAALKELEQRRVAGDREVAFRLNEILRASLYDPSGTGGWRPFMPRDDLDIDHEEWSTFWVELEMRYHSSADQMNDENRKQRWMDTARNWIERLPDQVGVRAHL